MHPEIVIANANIISGIFLWNYKDTSRETQVLSFKQDQTSVIL